MPAAVHPVVLGTPASALSTTAATGPDPLLPKLKLEPSLEPTLSAWKPTGGTGGAACTGAGAASGA